MTKKDRRLAVCGALSIIQLSKTRYEDYTEQTIYFFILEKAEKVDAVEREIKASPWAGTVRFRYDMRDIPEGYKCIRIFSSAATKEAMLQELQHMVGAKDILTFGSMPGLYDVIVEDADKDRMVKELKRRFEPVSLKGWKNIFSR